MKRILALSILLVTGFYSIAQDLSLYEKKVFVKGKDSLPYRILLPKNYDAKKEYPLVLFLHGAGERGRDNEMQLVHGSKLFLRDSIRDNYPAIVVFPQCPRESFWSNVEFKQKDGKRELGFKATGKATIAMELTQELLKSLMTSHRVKRKQVYVMGLSMGGMGTFEIVRRSPGLFAAAIPICGGGAPSTAKDMKDVKWWVFHGGKDDVVPPSLSEEMVNALKEAKADVKYTLYPEANHNSWDPAFAEAELIPWLFSIKK